MRDIYFSIKTVFRKPLYLVLAVLITLLLLLVNAIVINKGLITFLLQWDIFDWSIRLRVIGSALLNAGAVLGVVDKIFLLTLSVLAGISVVLLLYFIKRRIRVGLEGGASLAGIILSFIGIGCASCGSVILSSVIGLSTATAFISFLPLDGLEIGLASFVLLGWSIYSVSKKIQNPLLCKIPQAK